MEDVNRKVASEKEDDKVKRDLPRILDEANLKLKLRSHQRRCQGPKSSQ